MIRRNLAAAYSPLYFLAALGAGGVAVTFFLYLMFMVDHPDTPLVTFNHLWPLLSEGSALTRGLIGLGMGAMAVFSLLHFRLLGWNLREYRRFRNSPAFQHLKTQNTEATLMTIPLTLAMSINVAFVNGAVFIPDLWHYVEYLFPFALVAFLAIGVYALRLYTRFFTRLLTTGSFDFIDNNNLGQMVSVFAFAMIAVGLAAPGAMSHHQEVNAMGIFFSIFFASIAVVLGLIKFVLGFKSMLRLGIAPIGSPSLWIVIPILTLLGITMIRMSFGLQHGFNAPVSTAGLFVLTSVILSLQILFGLIGYSVMRRIGYFEDFLHGDQKHPGAYALICPGVALFVFGMFFIVFGLQKNGLVERFSLEYFLVLAPFVYIQLKTILTMLKLNRRLLQAEPAMA
jgi:hypothetical protein